MEVLSELRILSSADFDATSLLTVVLSGDGRLLELLRQDDLVPLGTRIRTRLDTEAASREELSELLSHALAKAGNATLMTAELRDTLVDHAAGNYRLLMTMGGELLAYGMAHEVAQLDEKCYLEVFQPAGHARRRRRKRGSDDGRRTSPEPLPVVRVAEIPREDQPQRWLVEQLWGDFVGRRDRRRPQVFQDLAGTGPGPERGHRHGLPGQVRRARSRVRSWSTWPRTPCRSCRERVAGMARHRGLDLAQVEIHVITAPTLRLDRDPHRSAALGDGQAAAAPAAAVGSAGATARHRREQRRRSGRAVGLLPLAAAAAGPLGDPGASHAQERRGRSRRRPGPPRLQRPACLRRLQPLPPAHQGASAACPASTAPRRPRRRCTWNWSRPTPRRPIWRSSPSVHGQKPASLQEQVLALLADGVVQTRAKLRESLGVKNERLGETLESLEQAGQIRRTPTGWQRVD